MDNLRCKLNKELHTFIQLVIILHKTTRLTVKAKILHKPFFFNSFQQKDSSMTCLQKFHSTSLCLTFLPTIIKLFKSQIEARQSLI